MGKRVHDDVLDGLLEVIKNNCTQISICKNTPTTYGHATTPGTHMLAIKSDLDSDNFTITAGDISGRKLVIDTFVDVAILASGDATHICLMDVDDRLLYVTTCALKELVVSNLITIPTWKIEIAAPTA